MSTVIEEFEDYYEEQREDINDRIQEMLEESDADREMREMIHHAIEGGKRFRPTLCMLTFDLFGGEKRERALTHASIIELIHLTSLTHDDIIDMDRERRGKKSLWNRLISKSLKGVGRALPDDFLGEMNPKIWGKIMADNVLLGDGMVGMGLRFVEDPAVMRAIAEGMFSLSEGAFLEADSYIKTKVFGTSEDKYINIIKGKTASLFALSTQVGTISAKASMKDQERLRKVGLYLGVCYQLADDLSEGEVPKGVDPKGLMKKYAHKYDDLLDSLPDNKHKRVFEQLVPYMTNKLMSEEDYPQAFLKVKNEGYKFVDAERVSWLGYG